VSFSCNADVVAECNIWREALISKDSHNWKEECNLYARQPLGEAVRYPSEVKLLVYGLGRACGYPNGHKKLTGTTTVSALRNGAGVVEQESVEIAP